MLLKKRSVGLLFLLGLILVGCETTNPHEVLMNAAPVSALKKNKTIQPHIAQAFLLLKEGKYSEASTYINQTLQAQPKNVGLHILNGLTYEKLAEQGDETGLELATIGYQSALNLDPFNSFAITQLGKLKYRAQQFDQAQEHFANALLIKPNDPDLIHEFAAASYYAYDIKSAVAAIRKAEKLKPDDPLIQRSAAMLYAAVGDFETAEKHFKLFQAKMGNDPEVVHVANRFNDWQSLYKSGRLVLAADKSNSISKDSGNKDITSKDSGSKDTTSKDSGSKDATSTATTITTTTTTTTTGSTSKESTSTESAAPTSTSKDSGSTSSESTSSGSKDTGSTTSESTGSESKESTSTEPAAPPSGSKDTGSTGSESKESTSKDSTAPASTNKDSGGTSSGGSESTNKDSGGGGGLTVEEPFTEESSIATKEEFARADIGQNILNVPVGSGLPKGPETPTTKQVIMDCYILQITEIAGTSKGNNILDNLAVTLNPGSILKYKGSMWGDGAAEAGTRNDTVMYTPDTGFATALDINGKLVNTTFQPASTAVNLNNAGSITGRIFTAGLTWAGLTYSLNIANAADNRTEIISRPTLMTYLGKESKFFSGVELVNVTGGTYGSNLSRYPVGVSLGILPESLVGDQLTLSLAVESSLLQNANPNLLATVDVSKTRVDTTARIHLGETIMLGGIYERTEVDIAHGFPGLRDLPLIQYFFSHQSTVSARRSIVILLTPRSPDTVKSAVNRAMTRESVQPHVSELVSRNPDWFNPEVNAISIFSYINLDPILYYEFRTGDVLPPSWGYEVILNDKLAELSSFLYY